MAYGLVETDRRRQRPALPREAERRRDHDEQHQRRHLRARARHVRPHPERRCVVDRTELLSLAGRARRDVRRLRLRRLLDRHRYAEKYTQVHRDIMDGRFAAAPFLTMDAPRTLRLADARIDEGATIDGPCFIDDGVVVKTGARVGPYSVIGRRHRSSRKEPRLKARSSGRTAAWAARPPSATPSSAATATSDAASASRAAPCSATGPH